MIDNFDLIKPLFYFNENNNMFFHCQIVCRTKDHPGQKFQEGVRKTYFVRSREHLERLKEEIITLCNLYGARAYINPAGKDFSSVQTLLLMKIASDIHQGNVRNPRRCLNSAAGECKSRAPRWIVDIDNLDDKAAVLKWLTEYYKQHIKNKYAISEIGNDMWEASKSYYIMAEIPTNQGCHLIVQPFNLGEFQKSFPTIDVHKNSMGTLLYMPNLKN